MAEKVTVKLLAEELDSLRRQLSKLETRFERRLESVLEKASEKLRTRLDSAGERGHHGPVTDANARRRLVEQCAYLRAERRGFTDGNPQQDWLDAELEVDELLLAGWQRGVVEGGHEQAEIAEPKPEPEKRI